MHIVSIFCLHGSMHFDLKLKLIANFDCIVNDFINSSRGVGGARNPKW